MQAQRDESEDVRAELDAMQRCYDIINKLKPDAIVRVVEWLQRRTVPREQLFDQFRRAVEDELAGRHPRIATKYGGVSQDYGRAPTTSSMLKMVK